MDGASDDYKPKFRDMRIRPPKAGEKEAERDVHALKPGEVRCEWPGCAKAATARAPKSRDMPGEYYRFCTPHAGEYNKRWDFFSGMSEGEAARRMNEERMTGGRPTWAFRASNQSREAAAKLGGKYRDPLGVFGADGAGDHQPQWPLSHQSQPLNRRIDQRRRTGIRAADVQPQRLRPQRQVTPLRIR